MKPKRYPYSRKTTKSSLIVLGSEKLSNTLSQTLDASVKTQMRNRLLGVDTSQAKSTKMQELLTEPKKLVQKYADLALEEYGTYQKAINAVQHFSGHTFLGEELKKAIQDEITKRALNSKTKKE
ncbi:hypothetical protein [Streptococcus gallolyticus]|uniref:hypothetical protein n=1 Tax=Streptococcus gallolyticus TaxID=315405 RepID=UPI0034A31D77